MWKRSFLLLRHPAQQGSMASSLARPFKSKAAIKWKFLEPWQIVRSMSQLWTEIFAGSTKHKLVGMSSLHCGFPFYQILLEARRLPFLDGTNLLRWSWCRVFLRSSPTIHPSFLNPAWLRYLIFRLTFSDNYPNAHSARESTLIEHLQNPFRFMRDEMVTIPGSYSEHHTRLCHPRHRALRSVKPTTGV